MNNGDKVRTACGKTWTVMSVAEGVIDLQRGFGVCTEKKLVFFGSVDHRGLVRL